MKGLNIGVIGAAVTAGILFVILGTTLGIGGSVGQSIYDTFASNSWGQNITNESLTGLMNFASQLPLIGTMIGLIVVLALLLSLLVFGRKGKGGY